MQTTSERAPREHAVRVRVNTEELEFLRRVAAEQDRTVSGVLRIALRDFHERYVEDES
jgi:hypothetical protein